MHLCVRHNLLFQPGETDKETRRQLHSLLTWINISIFGAQTAAEDTELSIAADESWGRFIRMEMSSLQAWTLAVDWKMKEEGSWIESEVDQGGKGVAPDWRQAFHPD